MNDKDVVLADNSGTSRMVTDSGAARWH